MADRKAAATRKPSTKRGGEILSDVERAAMKETVRERKKAAKRSPEEARAAGEADVREAIAALRDEDRAMAQRVHELVRDAAPDLVPRTFYGMPAYARDGGNVVCFFQAGGKYKTRYSTVGFQQDASLDEGDLWPVAFALTKLTPATERRIVELIRKAAG